MKERMLVIGYDSPAAPERKRGWACGGVRPYYAESIRKAAKELDGGTGYSLVLIFGRVNVMDAVRTVRQVSNVPILVIRKQYDGMEKIAVLESGADEYIQCPIRLEEGMASVRALIRRYTKWNPCNGYVGCEPSKEGLCIIPEYRKVFVNRRELFFPGREFDLLHTLVSRPGRVFTYEQLFYKVWKEEGDHAESIMHSCIKRIRRRLETVSGFSARIENVRGVGYRYQEQDVL